MIIETFLYVATCDECGTEFSDERYFEDEDFAVDDALNEWTERDGKIYCDDCAAKLGYEDE